MRLAFVPALVVTLSAPRALAADPEAERQIAFSAGLLGLVGANYFTTPSDIPGGYEGLGFAGDAGGLGWGVAAYGEARFVQHLGLALTLGRDSSRIQREVTYSGLVKVNERLDVTSTRLGVMAKGVLPGPFGRAFIGFGPVFVLGPSADATNEIVSGEEYVPAASRATLAGLIRGGEKGSTLMDFAAGLAIHAGDLIEIPIELHVAKNLSQDEAWQDRVKLEFSGTDLTGYEVAAQSSWEFRLGAGIGARF